MTARHTLAAILVLVLVNLLATPILNWLAYTLWRILWWWLNHST